MEVERRRYQNYLQCSGIAVILFTVWSIIKGFAFFISNWGKWVKTQPEDVEQILNTAPGRILIIIFFGIGSLIMLAFHYWIGKGAICESRGIRLKRPYVAGAVFLFIITGLSISATLINAFSENDRDAVTVNTTIIDLSLLFALGEMIHSAWKVRKLTRQSEQNEA